MPKNNSTKSVESTTTSPVEVNTQATGSDNPTSTNAVDESTARRLVMSYVTGNSHISDGLADALDDPILDDKSRKLSVPDYVANIMGASIDEVRQLFDNLYAHDEGFDKLTRRGMVYRLADHVATELTYNKSIKQRNIEDAKSIATRADNSTTTTNNHTEPRPWYAHTIESDAFRALTPAERKSTITTQVRERLQSTSAFTRAPIDEQDRMVRSEVNDIMGTFDSMMRKLEREAKIQSQRAEYERQRRELREVNTARAIEAGVDASILDGPIEPVESDELREMREAKANLERQLRELEQKAKYAKIQPLIDKYESGLTPKVNAVEQARLAFDEAKATLEGLTRELNEYKLTDPRRIVDGVKSTTTTSTSTPRVRRVRQDGESGPSDRTQDKTYATFRFTIPVEDDSLLVNKPHVVRVDGESTVDASTWEITVKGERSNNAYYAGKKQRDWLNLTKDEGVHLTRLMDISYEEAESTGLAW